ncbi:hypothetical protein ABKV37_002719 [Salmonella enterica]|nr:hypothetical protein [Salmonella enterica]EGH3249885.1 hypothetical protein [Salmonella enterica]ELZ5074000.1 hypothetical protein [Salmonella enterica]
MIIVKQNAGLSGANWIKGVGFTSEGQNSKEKARKGKRSINFSRRKAGSLNLMEIADKTESVMCCTIHRLRLENRV